MSTTEEQRKRQNAYCKEWRRRNPEKYKEYQAKYREKCRQEREEKRKAADKMSCAALFLKKSSREHYMWLYNHFHNLNKKKNARYRPVN